MRRERGGRGETSHLECDPLRKGAQTKHPGMGWLSWLIGSLGPHSWHQQYLLLAEVQVLTDPWMIPCTMNWFWLGTEVVSTLCRCLHSHPSSAPLTDPDCVGCCDAGPRVPLCWPLMLIKILQLLSFFTGKPKLEYNGSCVSISRVWAVSVIFCWSRQPLPCWPIRGQY